MASEALLQAGCRVVLAEHKPSVARKLLMAGKSGLNITKDEPFEAFLSHYGTAAPHLRPYLEALPPAAVTAWAEALGQETFTGSTGRVFPKAMKASPLLRAWLARLDGMDAGGMDTGGMGADGGSGEDSKTEGRNAEERAIDRRTRWRWTGWNGPAATFDIPQGTAQVIAKTTVLALGGASWARLGSDGDWAHILEADGIATTPFAPSNAGLLKAWSDHMQPHFGAPLKGIGLSAGALTSRGEAVISARGLEGGGLYPLTPAIREGHPLFIDLAPDLPEDTLAARLKRRRSRESLSNHLRKAAGLSAATRALLLECARPLPNDAASLARQIKRLEVSHDGLRPLDEAISTAGGLPFSELDDRLMLRARPGTYCAGEMLDWEAPTGGYLLTASLATGLAAGRNAAAWAKVQPASSSL
ncbi:NAD(FAD)-utilizing dehydrogenase [Salipiger pallidus]|uniref:NAD(FAD)-utilizing dehydrogenase n=2 Tax=Salipiger pallidus TaxID=1775170 RepID=A0A8J2ZJD2_9RHOB|nr:NAD(FAD)-utilizing dehydrogenase [Salipiger pallidus]